jgi:hypothetical protein
MPIIVYVEDDTYFLPFDNVTASTGVAVANPVSYTGITVFVTFRDEQGNQFLIDRFDLGPLAHTAFSLAERFPQSAGRRGVVELTTSAITMSQFYGKIGKRQQQGELIGGNEQALIQEALDIHKESYLFFG